MSKSQKVVFSYTITQSVSEEDAKDIEDFEFLWSDPDPYCNVDYFEDQGIEIENLDEKFSQDSFSDKIYPLHEFDIIDLETSEDGQDEWQTLDGKIDIEDEFYNHLDLREEDENYEHSDLEFDEYVQDILGFEETHSNSFFESTPIDIDEDIPF